MPKTVDNDVYPISLTLGATTAARESALFFSHVVNECTASPRMLVIHECMGRHSGFLTADAARQYVWGGSKMRGGERNRRAGGGKSRRRRCGRPRAVGGRFPRTPLLAP
jgi:hypothetical protein